MSQGFQAYSQSRAKQFVEGSTINSLQGLAVFRTLMNCTLLTSLIGILHFQLVFGA